MPGLGGPGSEQDKNRLEGFVPRGLWPPSRQIPGPRPPTANTHQLPRSQQCLPSSDVWRVHLVGEDLWKDRSADLVT